MSKMSRLICVAIAMIMVIAAVFTGCGSNDRSEGTSQLAAKETTAVETTKEAPKGPDISKAVKLNILLAGEAPKDQATMLEELNKLTRKDINAEMTATNIGWGDWGTKYPLMIMSGQDLDIIYTANWAQYAELAQKLAFAELDGLIKDYAPNISKKVTEPMWAESRVNGKIYAVPRNFEDIAVTGVVARLDLMKKYGMATIASIDDVMKFAEAVKANEKDIKPFAGAAGFPLYHFLRDPKGFVNNDNSLGSYSMGYYVTGEKPQIVYDFEDPLYIEAAKKARELYLKDIVNKDALTSKTFGIAAFESGLSAMVLTKNGELTEYYNKIMKAHPDWEIGFFPFAPKGPQFRQAYNASAFSISSASANKERAMMFMDKPYESEDYFMLLTYGVKDKHWAKDTDETITLPDGADPTLFPLWQCPWGYGDCNNWYKFNATGWPENIPMIKGFKEYIMATPLQAWVLNTEPIKNELAALNQVTQKYYGSIDWGVVDTDEGIKKALEDAKAAGLEKVKAELQKQIDEFWATKK